MRWIVSHLPEHNILQITTSGLMSVEHLNQMISETLPILDNYMSHLILVDHRQVKIALSIIDAYNRPRELERLGSSRNLCIAQVCLEKYLEQFRFLETVSINQGYQLRVFTDNEAAISWLIS
ncbi:hypothetical protein JXQ70_13030 [bacterium]|nr:hypothetical protein [bacterium]